MKKSKKIVIISVISCVVVASIAGILGAVKSKNQKKKSVKVFAVSELAQGDWDGDNNYMWGNVESTMIQNIYLSANQKVDKVNVKEGQTVKAGDVLIVYDTTAQELALDLKRADVEIARTNVIVAERELEELKEYVPKEERPVKEPEEEPTTEAPTTEEPTTEAPTTEAPTTEEPTTEAPTTEAPTTEEPTTEEPTTEAPTTEAPENNQQQNQNQNKDDDIDVPDDEEHILTKKELEKAIADKEAEIKSLRINYQLMQIDLEIMEYQNSNGEVVALFDGQVTSVLTEDEALLESKPMVVVSGDSGCTISANIAELSLGKVSLGDSVNIYSYETGMSYTGTVSEITTTPSSEYSYDNSESYYPIKITVADATDLRPGMGVDVTMITEEMESDDFYLPMAFVRKDNGKYYVMRDNNGVLEKRYITVGKILWGDQIKVYSGVTMDDKIAFPYSKDAVEGVSTTPGKLEQLYGF